MLVETGFQEVDRREGNRFWRLAEVAAAEVAEEDVDPAQGLPLVPPPPLQPPAACTLAQFA
jgi:hypothetical protein